MRYRSSGLLAPEKNLRDIIQNQMSVTPYSNGQLANGTRRSWISTAAFDQHIFSYTTTVNPTTFQTTGSLGAVTGADGATCPAGRVLRENGKKLYPVAHDGIDTYMIGVFDPVSFLSGYIDPNSQIFAVYNTDKPASLDTILLAQGVNANGGAADLAPPIYTAGTVTAIGEITSSGQIRSSNTAINAGTLSDNSNIVIDNVTYTGQNFTIACTNGGAITGVNFDFASGGTVGDEIITIIANAGNTIGLASGTNSRIPSTGITLAATGSGPVSIIRWISNGTNFYVASITTGMAA